MIKIGLDILGRPDLKSLPREDRMVLYATWLNKQRNVQGWGIGELLNFLLYGSTDD